jgi:VIT1/CCC1 family predicted Fe2+/Mn2+ transporter/rubrerythrin
MDTDPPWDRAEVGDRIVKAWRGEVLAENMYALIAQRLPQRQAELVRQIAQVEDRHRLRLEQRMHELGAHVPDPGTVRVRPWLRLQARIAPVDRLLAAREASEEADVDAVYRPSTGDALTDRLFASIRAEERSHAVTLQQMREQGDDAGSATGATATSDAKQRLDRVLGREKWHRRGGGWIADAIYGANDGLASVFGIVAGVSGATGGSSFVLTAGLSGAVASSLSMATGAFMASRSEAEVVAANVARERQEIAEHPEEEREELSLFYQLKGINEQTANELAGKMAEHPDAMLQALSAEELGVTESGNGDPAQSALAAGVSTGLGAIIPVIPFMFTTGTTAIAAAAIVSIAAHFLVGAAKSLVTLRTWWSAGLEMSLAGVIVGGATYLIGLALPT